LNRESGQSKGYAFVTFNDRRDAEDGFKKFQGYTLEGRRLRLDWDIGLDKKTKYRERRPSPRRSSPRRSASPRSRSPPRSPTAERKRSRSPAPATEGNSSPSDKKQKVDD